jgi:cation transport ATPase
MATKEVSSMATKLAVDPLAAEIPTDEHRRPVQIKVSGLMCSFCTMSVEEALRWRPDVNSVLVNMVHRVVLVEADMSKSSREELAARSSIGTEVSL